MISNAVPPGVQMAEGLGVGDVTVGVDALVVAGGVDGDDPPPHRVPMTTAIDTTSRSRTVLEIVPSVPRRLLLATDRTIQRVRTQEGPSLRARPRGLLWESSRGEDGHANG